MHNFACCTKIHVRPVPRDFIRKSFVALAEIRDVPMKSHFATPVAEALYPSLSLKGFGLQECRLALLSGNSPECRSITFLACQLEHCEEYESCECKQSTIGKRQVWVFQWRECDGSHRLSRGDMAIWSEGKAIEKHEVSMMRFKRIRPSGYWS